MYEKCERTDNKNVINEYLYVYAVRDNIQDN